jgi:hypothetical protein
MIGPEYAEGSEPDVVDLQSRSKVSRKTSRFPICPLKNGMMMILMMMILGNSSRLSIDQIQNMIEEQAYFIEDWILERWTNGELLIKHSSVPLLNVFKDADLVDVPRTNP